MISTTIGLSRALPTWRVSENIRGRVGVVALRRYHDVSPSSVGSKTRFSNEEMKRFYRHLDGALKSARNTVERLEKISVTEQLVDQGKLGVALVSFGEIFNDIEDNLPTEIMSRLHRLFRKLTVATASANRF